AERRVDAHAQGRRAVRVLGAELAAGEPAVVDAHLLGSAGEPRADAAARTAAVERAVLQAYGAAVALRVVGASRTDAVARRSRAVVEASVAGGAICAARALDARAARPGRVGAFPRIGRERRDGGVCATRRVMGSDAFDAGHEVG